MSDKNIVIIGGSYAGINTAHYLLQFVLPALSSGYRITLINTSSEFYHRIAAPRAILSERLLTEDKYLISIPQAFSSYSSKQFQFIQGVVISVSDTERGLVYRTQDTNETSLAYTALIIASGARSLDPVLSSQTEPDGQIRKALDDIRAKLTTATHVVVGGGGPAGVEAASEIGEFLNGRPGWFGKGRGKAKVTLISGGNQLLPVLRPELGKQAEKMIKELGVETRYGVRVKSSKEEGGKTRVELEDGEILEADVYINAIGTRPETEFLPACWRDVKGRVVADESLRVKGAERVYTIGDVHDQTRGGMLDLYDSVPVLATNIKADLQLLDGIERTHGDRLFKGSAAETQLVTIGQSQGVGAFNGMKIPSIVIWGFKGRDYLSGKTREAIEGKKWKKEVAWKATPLKVS